MLIGGLQKVSFIDYPGKISCILFTQGCNFRCPFCHNASLVDPIQFQSPISEEEILAFLSSRSKFIDGVVISGGEPTLHKDLKIFIEKIKNLNFTVKLDTNGGRTNTIIDLVRSNLIDFIAMDIKHTWEKYPSACGISPKIDKIKQSLEFIMSCAIDYEFRTTIVPGIHSGEDIKKIAQNLHGAKKFVIQQFVPKHALSMDLRQQNLPSIFDIHNQFLLSEIKTSCLQHVEKFEIRSAN